MVIALDGIGEQRNDVIHQHQAAQAVDAGAAQHGEQAQVLHAIVQTLDHFSIGEVIAFEEAIHQSLVGLCNSFLQSIVEFFDNGQLVIGNLDLNPLQVLHLVCTLIQHVYDTGNLLGSIPDGNNNRSDLIAVLFTQSLESGIVIGMILVHL